MTGILRAEWVHHCRQRQNGYITQVEFYDLYRGMCDMYNLHYEEYAQWYFRRQQMEEELCNSHRKDYTITPEIRLPGIYQMTHDANIKAIG